MASGYQGDGASRPLPSNEVEASAPNTEENRRLLEQVLEATLQLGSKDEPFQEEELRSLISTARRRRNEPLTVDTVTELVQTVLRLRYRQLIDARATWEKMTRQIAETVFEDPPTRAKLDLLWARLCEAAK